MALKLAMLLCIHNPPHQDHFPPLHKPLRIETQGPLETIQKVLVDVVWHSLKPFLQPVGRTLESLTRQTLYRDDNASSWLMIYTSRC
jgi:hypothetical protein